MVSIIIPTLNEAEQLPATLDALADSGSPTEVIVVDAGSQDATVLVAQQFGARVLSSTKGQRAAQMNAGALAAQGEYFLFLHADTRLAPLAVGSVEEAFLDQGVVGCGFARRFDSPSRFLGLTCYLAAWRGRCLGWFFGDQAISVRRDAFTRIGGFRPWDAFEDLDLCRRLKAVGRMKLLRPAVVTSARRFEARGPVRRTVQDLWLTVHHLATRGPD